MQGVNKRDDFFKETAVLPAEADHTQMDRRRRICARRAPALGETAAGELSYQPDDGAAGPEGADAGRISGTEPRKGDLRGLHEDGERAEEAFKLHPGNAGSGS